MTKLPRVAQCTTCPTVQGVLIFYFFLITKVLTIPSNMFTSTSGLSLASLLFPIQFWQDPSLYFSWIVDLAL